MKKLLASMLALGFCAAPALADDSEAPKSACDGVRFVPTKAGEKPNIVGYKLYAIRAESPFAKFGLQNGDLLTSVDGLSATTDGTDEQEWGAQGVVFRLCDRGDHRATLKRHGQETTVKSKIE